MADVLRREIVNLGGTEQDYELVKDVKDEGWKNSSVGASDRLAIGHDRPR